jgi:hypothetical protein
MKGWHQLPWTEIRTEMARDKLHIRLAAVQYASGECKGSDNPWWQVDLGANYNVNKIQIWNRTDCCSERLTNYRIWTKASNGGWEEFSPGVKTYNPGEQYPLSFTGNKQARYVMIQLIGKGVFLSLAEVKVFGSN